MKEKWSFGFTIVELLIVIVLIGVISTITFIYFPNAQKRGQDAQRQSDLNQYRVALENYAAANNSLYPLNICGTVTTLCNFGTFKATYLSGKCLQDPSGGTAFYTYCSDANGSKYAVWAKLEMGTNDYFEICSDGKSGRLTGNPAVGGNCSL